MTVWYWKTSELKETNSLFYALFSEVNKHMTCTRKRIIQACSFTWLASHSLPSMYDLYILSLLLREEAMENEMIFFFEKKKKAFYSRTHTLQQR